MEDLPTPTGRELELLKVMWEHGPKSVSDIHKLLDPADGWQPHPNTVQTLLRLMASKGLVSHKAEGRTFIYAPVFSREQSAARYLERVFDGAASQLVKCLLDAERIPPGELSELKRMIDQARRNQT